MTREEKRAYDRRWYAKHKKRICGSKRRNGLRWQKALRDWVRSLKRKPCKDCRRKWPPYVMQFDHVRGLKLTSVADLVSAGAARSVILVEIAKCDLVCANCHAIRTVKRRGE